MRRATTAPKARAKGAFRQKSGGRVTGDEGGPLVVRGREGGQSDSTEKLDARPQHDRLETDGELASPSRPRGTGNVEQRTMAKFRIQAERFSLPSWRARREARGGELQLGRQQRGDVCTLADYKGTVESRCPCWLCVGKGDHERQRQPVRSCLLTPKIAPAAGLSLPGQPSAARQSLGASLPMASC
ncbi:hypothetical protein IQ07DRAFT_634776 [Pyrenochaeta sp. DS3sAY3a]|nr:hypothetical protein IQ07DRAFT_634776 [Pyrenochaeta sp. DS3sAY3a]